jgi:hypothetical protein
VANLGTGYRARQRYVHYIRKLRADGAVVVLEYEGARANPWVPHPVALRRLRELADAAQFGEGDVVAETTSRYHGTLYCAVLRR